ncbi:DUF2911 domain-containing protein [Arenibacter sp. M-2]|uniref:DUF2911 domain-containing protein n=1 Tax=Gelatiniphilus marinus TaxID=1759464 RepID=A0ABW5JXR8_9FLAO|nr:MULTISPECIES: DUF2911 domain-containing protein [unclassified Arenibacter]MCK0190713.1 DUF2911 domain-containing protein [Arenibacter sp. F20364]MDL5514087.1 DUF2911 domain-containing protein [Arenibacter sp. M-2]
MKKLTLLIAIALLIVSCKNEKTTSEEQKHNHNVSTEKVEQSKKKPLSPHTETMAMIGDAHIHIDYSSPGVRDRIIFGGLLAYDQVWQAGAHMATWIETNKDLRIKGKTLPAGKYGFFTIPSKDEWTIIFNSNWEQHGKDEYDEKDDVIRFKVKPTFSEEIKEHLEYKVDKVDDAEGKINLSWEKVSIDFNFKVEQ